MHRTLYMMAFLVLVGLGTDNLRFHNDFQHERKVSSVLNREGSSLDHVTRDKIASAVLKLSKEYQIDPMLILAIIKVESHFRITARSHKGAMGLMQVKSIVVHDVADELGLDTSRAHELQSDLHFNLQVGVHYFSRLLNRFHGDISKALMAYNHGPTAIARRYHNRSVPFSGYQRKVLKTYGQFAKL